MSLFRFVGSRGSLRAHLMKSSGGTFLLKLTSIALGFVIMLMLARVLGVKEYGAYIYAMAWIGLLSIPATMGFHQLLVRDISIYLAREDWGYLRGLLHFSNRFVLSLSIVLVLLSAFVSWLFIDIGDDSSLLLVFWIALLTLPFYALTQLRQAAMRGFQKIILGQLSELLIRPLLFIFIFATAAIFLQQYLNAQIAIAINVFVTIVGFLIGAYLLNKTYSEKVKVEELQFRKKTWLRNAFSFAIISGFQLVSTKIDIVMLGAIDNASVAGVYSVASQLAWLITVILMVVNTVLAPQISSLWAKGDKVVIQKIIVKAAQFTFLMTLCFWVMLTLLGEWFLGVFGDEFTDGYIVLVVLSSSLTICTVAASAGLLLTMTNHERYAAWLYGSSALLNILLNSLLIPKYSLNGAAIATGISVLLMNVSAILMVMKLTKLNPTIFRFR